MSEERTDTLTPDERLIRMQKMFNEERAVLVEDYKYFTHIESLFPGVSIHPNTVEHMSARLSERPSLRQN